MINEKMDGDEITNSLYFDKYKPEKKSGQGSFGTIYQGKILFTKV